MDIAQDTFLKLFSSIRDFRGDARLRYTEGLSYDEIAQAIGCSPGTVASRLNRAHKMLERRLAHLANQKGVGHA